MLVPDLPTPSDDELDALIKARLQLVGIDLGQLPPTTSDPETGAPSQATVLASLRTFLAGPGRSGERVGGTVRVVSSYVPPAPEGTSEADRNRLAQQVAPPALYPSIYHAWTDGALDR